MDDEIYGYVVRLIRKEGELEGQVTLSDYSDNKPRSVRITLNDADYQGAFKANGEGLLVSCTAELVKEGQFHPLKNPDRFAFME